MTEQFGYVPAPPLSEAEVAAEVERLKQRIAAEGAAACGPPRSIRIAGETVAVEVDTKLLRKEFKRSGVIGDDPMGLSQYDQMRIVLADDKRIHTTLMHELMHFIGYQYMSYDDHLTERQLDRVAVGMLQIIRDNPGLVEWLVAERHTT